MNSASPGEHSAAGTDSKPPQLITTPADGIPPVVNNRTALAATLEALASGTGPLAVDTERAQSFRYSAKAYLIQVRRSGSGTHLIDPVAFEGDADRADLSAIVDATGDDEWIIHAATQDLGCLAEVGMVPRRLFDTELAGRLLGLPKVSLGALVEVALDKALLKEHSAADWSKRPLPQDWLAYAALDVELLVELRDWVASALVDAGKEEWARQEFAHLAEHAADPPHRRADPWRRTSGIHDVRSPRGLAYVRELWETRDDIARRLDRAPGHVLNDRAIAELATKVNGREGLKTLGRDQLRSVRGFSWRVASRYQSAWLDALERVNALSREELPPLKQPSEGPPPPRTWANRFPEAAQRWDKVRPATVALAEKLNLPVENLIAPDAVRRLCFTPPQPADEASVDAFLAELEVRPWQRELVVPLVTPLLG